jgi:hypothetical protein
MPVTVFMLFNLNLIFNFFFNFSSMGLYGILFFI